MSPQRIVFTLGIAFWLGGCGNTAALIFDPPETASETKAKAPPPPTLVLPETPPAAQPAVARPPQPVVAASEIKPAVPAPTPTPTPAPTAAPAPAPDADIASAIDTWRDAWERQQVDTYLKQYVPGFKGQESSPEKWQAKRRQIITRAGKITLQLGSQQIARNGPDQASVTFEQSYRSSKLRDEGTKQLQLRRVDGRWLIEQEDFAPAKK